MKSFQLHLVPLILTQLIIIPLPNSAQNPTDLAALLDFKNRITDDPLGIMASWNNSSNYCNWSGITCDRFSGVTVLDLKSQKLQGSLPNSIGNLSFLTGLNLRNNNFRGQIPEEISSLSRLKHLNLTYNSFTGTIPSNISKSLTVVAVEYNYLSGNIPFQLSSLTQLQYLGVGSNNLTGGFPFWIANFSSSFFGVSLALNTLQGGIPPEIGVLSGLRIFQVYGNQFSGELPASIYNISSMKYFSVTQNLLHGEIPPDIGVKFPVLEVFAGGVNSFTGKIPDSLSNASRLQVLDFAENRLMGTVPSGLGRLPFLYRINFDENNLGNGKKGDMDMEFISFLTNCTSLEVLGLSTNFFGGEFPKTVANLSSSLEILTLGGNAMHGSLPLGIGNLVNLTLLGVEGNYLTGTIPDDIGTLANLGQLYLTGNELTGTIPFSFGNLSKLSVLKLDSNRLLGSIPSEIGKCSSLHELNLSSNNLTGMIPKEVMSLASLSKSLSLARNALSGSLPSEVGKLVNLKEIDVSDNMLSGGIPGSLGGCISLEILLLGGNRFNGTIPRLEALRGLEVIDFSNNNLSGKIPQFLEQLPFVKKLDLSGNDLEGEVSSRGVFSNASLISVNGNERLCGGAPFLHLPPCSKITKRAGKNRNFIITVTASVVVVFVVVLCSLIILYLLHKKNHNAPSSEDLQSGITYHELYRSTDGFSSDNLIGSGSFGSVYRGVLEQNGPPVAIKVLNLKQKGATKSFVEECTILRSVRHRNLLKIITVCSSSDHEGNEFKCLVSELMPNGNLDEWLHSSPTKSLSLLQRLSIAMDVANAIDYLHNHSHVPIIHCDLKPSNILLDEDLTARVADFGLSKFILQEPNRPLTHLGVSAELKGSIGYIPPEYGASSQISTLGDVYSYGILVLELFTGKRPTDDMFNDGLNIHTYVAKALPDHIMEVLDASLIVDKGEDEKKDDETGDILAAYRSDFQEKGSSKMDHLVSVMKIGVSCSMSQAKDRMPINVVVNQLQAINDLIFRAGKSRSQRMH